MTRTAPILLAALLLPAAALAAEPAAPARGIPAQLDAAQRDGYAQVFSAIRESRWTDAQIALDAMKPGPPQPWSIRVTPGASSWILASAIPIPRPLVEASFRGNVASGRRGSRWGGGENFDPTATTIELRPRGAPSPGLSPKKPWGRGEFDPAATGFLPFSLPHAVCGGGPGREAPAGAVRCLSPSPVLRHRETCVHAKRPP